MSAPVYTVVGEVGRHLIRIDATPHASLAEAIAQAMLHAESFCRVMVFQDGDAVGQAVEGAPGSIAWVPAGLYTLAGFSNEGRTIPYSGSWEREEEARAFAMNQVQNGTCDVVVVFCAGQKIGRAHKRLVWTAAEPGKVQS